MNHMESKIVMKTLSPPAMGLYAFRVPKNYLREAKRLGLDIPSTLRAALHFAISSKQVGQKKKAVK